MTQEELKILLRKKIVSRRYVADATGMSLPAVHLFIKGNSDRKMSVDNWERFLNQLKKDRVKITIDS